MTDKRFAKHQYLCADAHVLLAGGRWMPAARLREADEVVVLVEKESSGVLQRSWKKAFVSHLERISDRPTVVIGTEHGMVLSVSPQRLVKTRTGVKLAAAVEQGDEVAVVTNMPGVAASPLEPDDAVVVAAWMMCWEAGQDRINEMLLAESEKSDEDLLPRGAEWFRSSNRALVSQVLRVARDRRWAHVDDGERFSIGPGVHSYPALPTGRDDSTERTLLMSLDYADNHIHHSNPWAELLRKYKMRHLASMRSRVPGSIPLAATETMTRFINAMFGFNEDLVIEAGHIAFPHHSHGVCESLQHMLWRLGIYTELDRGKHQSTLHMRGAGNLHHFLSRVGITGKGQWLFDELAGVIKAADDLTDGLPQVDADDDAVGWSKVTRVDHSTHQEVLEMRVKRQLGWEYAGIVVEGMISAQMGEADEVPT